MEGGGEQHEETNSDFEEELEVERVEEKESLPPRSEIHRNKEKNKSLK